MTVIPTKKSESWNRISIHGGPGSAPAATCDEKIHFATASTRRARRVPNRAPYLSFAGSTTTCFIRSRFQVYVTCTSPSLVWITAG